MSPRHLGRVTVLWTSFKWMIIIFLSPALTQAHICSSISNPNCHCRNSSGPSAFLQDILCQFTILPPVPMFTEGLESEQISLGAVDLSRNNLDHLPENFLQGVGRLERLILNYNNLTAIPAHLAHLRELQVLQVSHNSITSLDLTVLATIPGLHTLDLSCNRLRNLSWSHGEEPSNVSLQSLTELKLSGNLIKSIQSEVFTTMHKLLHLDLSHNSLTQLTSPLFSQLSLSLVALNLSHNALRQVQPRALARLQHLRVLDLSHNLLGDVKQVQFPQHLQSLDLSHCTLTIINHCRLTDLADLSFIGLRGNHLTCTCQLYQLLQWYQNQHHKACNLQSSTMDSNWTCILPPSTSATPSTRSPSPADSHHPTLATDPSPVGMQRVIDLKQCEDTESHCQTLEHFSHHRKGSSQVELTLDIVSSGNTLMASWTFEENGEVAVDGFQLRYNPEDGKPLTSPTISPDQRCYMMQPPVLEKHFELCLDVLTYETIVVHEECRSFRDESNNVLVGVLAGVTFLLPCAVVLIYIMVKDHRVRKSLIHPHLEHDVENSIEAHKTAPPQKPPYDNAGCAEECATDTPKTAPLEKPSYDNAACEFLEDLAHAEAKVPDVQQHVENSTGASNTHQHCSKFDTEKLPQPVAPSVVIQDETLCDNSAAAVSSKIQGYTAEGSCKDDTKRDVLVEKVPNSQTEHETLTTFDCIPKNSQAESLSPVSMVHASEGNTQASQHADAQKETSITNMTGQERNIEGDSTESSGEDDTKRDMLVKQVPNSQTGHETLTTFDCIPKDSPAESLSLESMVHASEGNTRAPQHADAKMKTSMTNMTGRERNADTADDHDLGVVLEMEHNKALLSASDTHSLALDQCSTDAIKQEDIESPAPYSCSNSSESDDCHSTVEESTRF